MKHTHYHLLIPAGLNLVFFINAFLPVWVLGCLGRGIVALVIALISGIAGIVCSVRAIKGQKRKDPESRLWILSALIFTVPVIALIALA